MRKWNDMGSLHIPRLSDDDWSEVEEIMVDKSSKKRFRHTLVYVVIVIGVIIIIASILTNFIK